MQHAIFVDICTYASIVLGLNGLDEQNVSSGLTKACNAKVFKYLQISSSRCRQIAYFSSTFFLVCCLFEYVFGFGKLRRNGSR